MDEKQEVLDRIEKEINKNRKHKVSNAEWTVELTPLLVQFEKEDNIWKISKDTIKELASLTQFPFDLILSDYGFIADPPAMTLLEEQTKDPTFKLKEDDFKDFLLFPKDIKKRFEELNSGSLPHSLNPRINNWFLGHTAPVYIYTYTDSLFEQFLPINNSGDIETDLKDVFPNSRKIKYILTWGELFNRYEFQSIYDQNRAYYPFIVSKFLNLLILKELLKKVAHEQRFLSLNVTLKTVTWVIIIGVVVGGISEVLGKMTVKVFLELFTTHSSTIGVTEDSLLGKSMQFIIFIILTLLITFGVAVTMWFITEKFMTRLLNIDKSNEDKI